MRTPALFLALAAVLLCSTGLAVAQSPGVVTGGSSNTMIGGKPAARAGDDTTSGGPVVEGSPNVFIDGKPAATVGGRNGCGGGSSGDRRTSSSTANRWRRRAAPRAIAPGTDARLVASVRRYP